MTPEEHFVKSCLESPKQDFPKTAIIGDVLHYLDGTYQVYLGKGKWCLLEEHPVFNIHS